MFFVHTKNISVVQCFLDPIHYMDKQFERSSQKCSFLFQKTFTSKMRVSKLLLDFIFWVNSYIYFFSTSVA